LGTLSALPELSAVERKQQIIPIINKTSIIYGRSYHQLNNLGIIRMGVPIKKERRIVAVIKTGGTTNK
jgi:hypothetical protein